MLCAPAVVLRAVTTPPRLAAVLLLAALGLAWPLPVRAQTTITPAPVPLANLSSPPFVTPFVPESSTALQNAITSGGNVAGALNTYNTAVRNAASRIDLSFAGENVVPGAGTSVTLSSVASDNAW
jgi:hypothetical protein